MPNGGGGGGGGRMALARLGEAAEKPLKPTREDITHFDFLYAVLLACILCIS